MENFFMSTNLFYITEDSINEYISHLKDEERSPATIEKYSHIIYSFKNFLNGAEVTKQAAIEWENNLCETHKKTSINAMLVALNGFFKYFGLKISMKLLKIQRNTFISKDKILTHGDYERLVNAAKCKNDEQLTLLIQTLGSTGIRVSELKFITVEAALNGKTEVTNKSKTRIVFICKELKRLLMEYARKRGITSGSIFITRNGKCLDRSNIWRKVKNLSNIAKVEKSKLFTHNFRKMFAKRFYAKSKDLSKLADVLGHSNINTTRLYIMESGEEHLKIIESLKLVI